MKSILIITALGLITGAVYAKTGFSFLKKDKPGLQPEEVKPRYRITKKTKRH
jgi:hypothetical protein